MTPILLSFLILHGSPLPVQKDQEPTILIVGDSWADYMWQDRVLSQVMTAWGHPAVTEEGAQTAVSGTTAADWVQPARLADIEAALTANPTIAFVQVTVGGNDFLAGISGGGWFLGMPAAEEEALFLRVSQDIQTLLTFILDLNPGLEVVLSLYDYPNFVDTIDGPLGIFCRDLWDDLGQPAAGEINETLLRFSERIALEVQSLERVSVVGHPGQMQYHFGFPPEIPAGQLIPPGDVNLPTPQAALRFGGLDCFHLNAGGYLVLAERLYNQFYVDRLCVSPLQWRSWLTDWPNSSLLRLADATGRLCP